MAVRWMMAAPYLLKCHLRFNASVRENVSHILMPQVPGPRRGCVRACAAVWLCGRAGAAWQHGPNQAGGCEGGCGAARCHSPPPPATVSNHVCPHVVQELEWVLGWTHRPNAAATVIVNAVAAAKLDTNRELVREKSARDGNWGWGRVWGGAGYPRLGREV